MNTQRKNSPVLEIYDPSLCCSTGVCGEEPDDELMDFAATVKWLKNQGIEVKRYNLGQESEAFKSREAILSRLQNSGTDILPILMIDGEVVFEGAYPEREKLADWLHLNGKKHGNEEASQKSKNASKEPSEETQVLVALASALASNSEESLKFYLEKAQELDIPQEYIAGILQISQNVKQQSSGSIIELTNKLLGNQQSGCQPGGGCC